MEDWGLTEIEFINGKSAVEGIDDISVEADGTGRDELTDSLSFRRMVAVNVSANRG